MERLTFDGNFCDISQCRNIPGGSFCEDGACYQKKVWERLKRFEDTVREPELFFKMYGELPLLGSALKHYGSQARLRELAEADKDGRVVVLPCKVGDTVWFKTYKNSAQDCIGIQPHEITRISISVIVHGDIVDVGIPVDQIGQSAFLSKDEAIVADAESPAGNAILRV